MEIVIGIVSIVILFGGLIFLLRWNKTAPELSSEKSNCKIQSDSSIVGYVYDDFIRMSPDQMWDELSKLYGENIASEFLKTQILINRNKAQNIQHKSPQKARLLIEQSNQLQAICTFHCERKEIPKAEITWNDFMFGELVLELTQRRVDYFRSLCEQVNESSLNDISKLIHKLNEVIARERNEFWRRSVIDIKNMICDMDIHLCGGNYKLIHFHIILKHLVTSAKISTYNRHIIEQAISSELVNHSEESTIISEPCRLTNVLGMPLGGTQAEVEKLVAKYHPQASKMSFLGNLSAVTPGGTFLWYMGYDWMEFVDCSVRFEFICDRLWYISVDFKNSAIEINNSIKILADKLMADYPNAPWETIDDQTMRQHVGRDIIETKFIKEKNGTEWNVNISFFSYYYEPLVIT